DAERPRRGPRPRRARPRGAPRPDGRGALPRPRTRSGRGTARLLGSAPLARAGGPGPRPLSAEGPLLASRRVGRFGALARENMRRILPLLLVALPALAEEGLETRRLDNGLEVLVVEKHDAPIVTIEIAVRTGAFTEDRETNGLSHLYEHMFFKG